MNMYFGINIRNWESPQSLMKFCRDGIPYPCIIPWGFRDKENIFHKNIDEDGGRV